MSSVLSIKSVGEKVQKKYNFSYLSKKEFKELQKENEDIKVVGTTKLRTVSPEKMNEVDTYLSYVDEKEGQVYFKVTEPKKCWKRGYISVGDNKYLSYSRFGLPFLFILLGILLVLLLLCFIFGNNNNGKLELDDFKPIDLSQDVSDAEIKTYDFQMFGSYVVSEENPRIKVWNPETNIRTFKYDVYVDEELISTTKGIS